MMAESALSVLHWMALEAHTLFTTLGTVSAGSTVVRAALGTLARAFALSTISLKHRFQARNVNDPLGRWYAGNPVETLLVQVIASVLISRPDSNSV
jgi:hypothetical protein